MINCPTFLFENNVSSTVTPYRYAFFVFGVSSEPPPHSQAGTRFPDARNLHPNLRLLMGAAGFLSHRFSDGPRQKVDNFGVVIALPAHWTDLGSDYVSRCNIESLVQPKQTRIISCANSSRFNCVASLKFSH